MCCTQTGWDWQRDRASCACPLKLSWGENYPCLCNLPSPHILAAARLTVDPQSPLRAKWHLTSSFGHAMEKQPWVSSGRSRTWRYLSGHLLCGPQGGDPPSSVLWLCISICTTLLTQGCDSSCAPGAGLEGRWQVPTGPRVSPWGSGHPHGSMHSWWYGVLCCRAEPVSPASVPVTKRSEPARRGEFFYRRNIFLPVLDG